MIQSPPVSECSQHAECLQSMEDLCCWWSQLGASNECPYELLRERLHDLRPQLVRFLASQHFPGEHAQKVVANDPDYQSDAMLIADLDQLVMRLGACRPGEECWADLSHAIGLFMSRLRSCLSRISGRS